MNQVPLWPLRPTFDDCYLHLLSLGVLVFSSSPHLSTLTLVPEGVGAEPAPPTSRSRNLTVDRKLYSAPPAPPRPRMKL